MSTEERPARSAGFPARLQSIIEEFGSAAALARELKCSAMAVSGWRTGKNAPRKSMMERLAHVADVEPLWLSRGIGPRNRRSLAEFYDITPEQLTALEREQELIERAVATDDAISRVQYLASYLHQRVARELPSIYEPWGLKVTAAHVQQVINRTSDTIGMPPGAAELSLASNWVLLDRPDRWTYLVDLVLDAHRDAVRFSVTTISERRAKRSERPTL